ncbi:hypothetical protein [Brevibacillus porteri]|uniref:hypothetical protein n=1 Tax=Brevibacillus porteri TaxID=2126350 RepID=UPI002E1EACBE
MTFLAQYLPVAPIPELPLVSLMRDDMVHHRSSHSLAILHTVNTEWMLSKVRLSGTSPPGIIATLSCGSTPLVILPFVILTKTLGGQFSASYL